MTENVNVEDKKLIFLKRAVIFYFILLVLFFSLVFIVHAIAMTKITISDNVELEENIIELGDIAYVESDDSDVIDKMKAVELGISPSVGEEKTIDKNYIILRLKKEGFDDKEFELSCDEKILLHRTSETLTKNELENVVKEKISIYLDKQTSMFSIQELKGLEDIAIPQGKVDYKLDIRRNMSQYGRIVGNLNIFVDKELFKKLWIQAQIAVRSKVAKLNRNIKKGEVITKEDVVFDFSTQKDMTKNYIASIDDIAGLLASRNMVKGTILNRELFTKPNLINRGDEVLVVMNMDSLKITASGIAIENGGLGDVIKVSSNSSKKVIQGRIKSKGKVVIE